MRKREPELNNDCGRSASFGLIFITDQLYKIYKVIREQLFDQATRRILTAPSTLWALQTLNRHEWA
jgi:hypothetical protein